MAMPIPAREVAVGDYSADYGHVSQVRKLTDSVELTFVNGTKVTLDNDFELFIDQGGRF